MIHLAALFYAVLAPTAAGLFLALALLTETLATGLGLGASAVAGAGAAWPVSVRIARALRDGDAA